MGRSVESANRSTDGLASAEQHVEYMLGLAELGLVPKVFWWCTPEVAIILDGARRVAAAAGARAEAAKAFAIQCNQEIMRLGTTSRRAAAESASALVSRNVSLDAKKRPWGFDKWKCPQCGGEVRRSNKSAHVRRCPMRTPDQKEMQVLKPPRRSKRKAKKRSRAGR